MKKAHDTVNRWGRLFTGLFLVVAVFVWAVERAASEGQKPQDTAGSQPRSANVWPNTPVFPWSEKAIPSSRWSEMLDAKLDLTRKGRAGERRRYRILRQNLALDKHGRVLSQVVSEGTLSRTLLRKDPTGLWTERIEWERFAYGQSQGPNDAPKMRELQQARGIAYDFSPRDFDYLNPPGDFDRISDPIVAYSMKVIGMDVTGFDTTLLNLRDRLGLQVLVGSVVRNDRAAKPERIGLNPNKEVSGGYQLGAATTTVAGITRCQGVPCALLWCSAEGNSIKQDMSRPQFTMHMDGTEYFRAEMAVSLLDGHLVAAELWGPILNVISIGQGNQSAQELPIAGVMQQVSLWEVH